MSTRMNNGAVLPTGLLSVDQNAMLAGFKKNYQNTSLRFGVVIKTYPKNDSGNISGLAPEYDVLTFEQNENKSSTPITYRNCLSSEGLGSIADFFEKTLRVQNRKGSDTDTKDQNGAIVLVLCLNGVSDKGIIIGAITHPDRVSTLVDAGPRLEGEFNGVNIKVEKDGSTTLTFNGATDNDGNIIDSSQGPTTLSIETDGSVQIMNKGVTQRLEKGGVASLTAQNNINNTTQKGFNVTAQQDIDNTTQKSFNITAQQDISLTATNSIQIMAQQLVGTITGSCALVCQTGSLVSSGSFGIKGAAFTGEAETMVNIKAPIMIFDGLVNLGGQGGAPVLTTNTVFSGIGNLGLPVISRAISGFATKVTAV